MKLTADQIETGGNAFPNPSLADENYRTQPGDMGMTLRDWFAAQALTGIIPFVASGQMLEMGTGADSAAYEAYTIADAMIAARTKGGAL